ncbi:AP endonuclease [Hortaea werneckii]|uniref:Apurinic-apyrimidinic endonuclease 1 n=1 Tax=Hortaea werneckii TaxID=91943 RepID=A0A3M7DLZ8_HORWE|nr:AP endonuclease [Hortaea werneckii]RMY65214.1 hypothetical protein D0863_09267 [Hortaea werneckii]
MPKRKRQQATEDDAVTETHHTNGKAEEQKPPKRAAPTKRKSKAEQEAELVEMPLAQRTLGQKLNIGAHVSAAGGVQQSVFNSVHIGANAFALFLKSQRKWANPPLQDDHCSTFHQRCKDHTYDQAQHVVPHGSYLVNLAHTDKGRTKQAYDSFLDDLKRCERLGIRLYNFHPGNDQCGDRPKSIAHLAANINKAHSETNTVTTVLENMAAGGNVLGSSFEDLRDIIALIDDKSRVGVCIDTCHAFAAGYDLRTPEAFKQTLDTFEEIVGFEYLRAMHINDSKAPFASNRDLHANIGTGFLGLRSFHNVVNEPRFAGLPLILETPVDSLNENGEPVKDEKGKDKEDKGIWAREIKLLESLVDMDVNSTEFVELERSLAKRGEPERNRLMEQVERKQKERADKAERAKTKGKRKATKEGKKKGDDRSESSGDSEINGSGSE